MINTDNKREYVATGLSDYLQIPVIRSNQNAPPPPLPYIVYTITTLESENNGTYGEYEDGIDRKAVTQIWSISALAATNDESVEYASRAKEWLDHAGTFYLNEHNVIVQRITSITNRDNVLSVEYEYKNGFDVTFWDFTEIESPIVSIGRITTVDIDYHEIEADIDDDMSYILRFEDGTELIGVVVGEQTVFTATANDIREDKTAATEQGVTVGTKQIPAYQTVEGAKFIAAGKPYMINLSNYEYTKMQAIICAFNTSLSNSVFSEKVAINDSVYAVQSTVAISTITQNDIERTIDFGLTNTDETPKIIRYFSYKEVD